MADWQEQLNTILSDPNAMSQIASIAQSLGAAGSPPPENTAETKNAHAPSAQSTSGGAEPDLLAQLAPLLRQLNGGESSSQTAVFLRALSPFLSEKRRAKVERAAQLARLIHLGKSLLIPPKQEGGDDV